MLNGKYLQLEYPAYGTGKLFLKRKRFSDMKEKYDIAALFLKMRGRYYGGPGFLSHMYRRDEQEPDVQGQ